MTYMEQVVHVPVVSVRPILQKQLMVIVLYIKDIIVKIN